MSEYRHREARAELYGGVSAGRVDGWVRRYSAGVSLLDDAYAAEPGRVAPARLAPDEKLVAPFVRFELIEDRYERRRNRNQIERAEFFPLGVAATLQLGYAGTGFGSSRNAWLYAATVSRGFKPAGAEQTLIATATLAGQVASGEVQRQRLGGTVQYYLPHARRRLFYAAASADVLTRPGPFDELLLGGDNGLRGYPLRYQSGTRRALFTLEERAYTDVYVYRLFRLGGAAFADVGRAWGGPNANTTNPGWLVNVGAGLRIASVRSAFNNVLHIDVAFPLNPDPAVKRVQFLVKTRASF